MEKLYTKAELLENLKSQIAHNDNTAIKALVKVYANQTVAEQNIGHTVVHNGIGFSGTDSEFLTSLANQYNERGSLSDKQIAFLKKIMPKYARQLLEGSFAAGNFEKVGRKYKIK